MSVAAKVQLKAVKHDSAHLLPPSLQFEYEGETTLTHKERALGSWSKFETRGWSACCLTPWLSLTQEDYAEPWCGAFFVAFSSAPLPLLPGSWFMRALSRETKDLNLFEVFPVRGLDRSTLKKLPSGIEISWAAPADTLCSPSQRGPSPGGWGPPEPCTCRVAGGRRE